MKFFIQVAQFWIPLQAWAGEDDKDWLILNTYHKSYFSFNKGLNVAVTDGDDIPR